MATSQPAAIRPKVTGTACCSSVRPAITVADVFVCQRGRAAGRDRQVGLDRLMPRRASSIAAVSDDVLARGAAVHGFPRLRRHRRRQLPDEGRAPGCRSASPAWPISFASNRPATATAVTAAPAPALTSPARSSALASAASVSSIACSQAWSVDRRAAAAEQAAKQAAAK